MFCRTRSRCRCAARHLKANPGIMPGFTRLGRAKKGRREAGWGERQPSSQGCPGERTEAAAAQPWRNKMGGVS